MSSFKRLVNGKLTELSDEAEIQVGTDRLFAKTAEGSRSALVVKDGDRTLVSFNGRTYTVQSPQTQAVGGTSLESGDISAPMPGLIVDLFVAEGQQVKRKEKLLVLEAMKTQNGLSAPFDGVITKIGVNKGDQVVAGQLLVKVEPNSG